MNIVLSMITYMTIERVGIETFMKVLESSLQVPYKAIILVDDTPNENTKIVVKEFAEKWGKELVIEKSRKTALFNNVVRPTRATARQTSIDLFFESFQDEWLFFLDDDAVLNPGWWDEAKQYLCENAVGEIWGINWDANLERKKFLTALGVNYEDWLIKAFMRRGGTHDTLYRRKALEGVKIPPELHICEDAWLHHYVRCNGWESRIIKTGITHYSPQQPQKLQDIKKRWMIALEIAVKYGIIEYEAMEEHFKMGKNKLKAYLSLTRPILGLPFMFITLLRVHGFKVALEETIMRQYIKLWQRYTVIKCLEKLERSHRKIPEICEIIKKYHKEKEV